MKLNRESLDHERGENPPKVPAAISLTDVTLTFAALLDVAITQRGYAALRPERAVSQTCVSR